MALVVAFWATSAAANDYPYSGNFTYIYGASAPGPDDLARCAFSFFAQDKSGAYVEYVLDMDAFKKTKVLRYLAWNRGACVYDPGFKLETCGQLSVPIEPFFSVIDQIGPDFVRTRLFDTKEHAKAYYETGNAQGGSTQLLSRCPFDPEVLAKALPKDLSKLSSVDSSFPINPEVTLLHAPITADIMIAAGLTKP